MYSQADAALYGIDWNGPISDSEDEEVQVPQTTVPLQEQDFRQLQETVLPTSNSDYQGVDLFIQTLEFVYHKLM